MMRFRWDARHLAVVGKPVMIVVRWDVRDVMHCIAMWCNAATLSILSCDATGDMLQLYMQMQHLSSTEHHCIVIDPLSKSVNVL